MALSTVTYSAIKAESLLGPIGTVGENTYSTYNFIEFWTYPEGNNAIDGPMKKNRKWVITLEEQFYTTNVMGWLWTTKNSILTINVRFSNWTEIPV